MQKLSVFALLLMLWSCVIIAQGTEITEAQIPPDSVFEDVPYMPKEEIKRVMDWIKVQTTGVKLPFCWRQSYGRGVGTPLSICAAGREKIGALCYSKCPANTKRVGFDCHSVCPDGMRDDGLFCRATEYGRGAGFPWKFGDKAFSLKDARKRCNKKHPERGCEKYGEIIYPKCKEGYSNFGCCICRPKTPDCRALGMNPGIDLSCAKKVTIGDPVPLICASDKVEDAGLCYPKCKTDFHGVGPVCWQNCAPNWANCAAGCAKTSVECGMVVADQVIAPLVLAASVASLGMSNTTTAAINAAGDMTTSTSKVIRIGGKTVAGSTKLGKAFVELVHLMQRVKSLSSGAHSVHLVRRVISKAGTVAKYVKYSTQTTAALYEATNDFTDAFADDFANQTSPAINRAIDNRFHPKIARFFKKTWGRQQLAELAEANGWVIAQDVLAVVSIADFTGVTGVVSAYAKPICQDITSFPCVSVDLSYPLCPSKAILELNRQAKNGRPGNDYHSFDTTVNDPLECQIACIEDPQCKAWSHAKYGTGGSSAKCYLKNLAANPVLRGDGFTSGVNPIYMGPVERGMGRPGNNYRYFYPNPANAEMCQAACANENRCNAWEYYAPQRICYLKDPAPGPVKSCADCAAGARLNPNVSSL